MSRLRVVGLAVALSLSVPGPAVAGISGIRVVDGDLCDVAPSLVAEFPPSSEDRTRPVVVGDRVWFGGSIHDGAGTPVGIEPGAPVAGAGLPSTSWGVAVITPDDGRLFASTPDGSLEGPGEYIDPEALVYAMYHRTGAALRLVTLVGPHQSSTLAFMTASGTVRLTGEGSFGSVGVDFRAAASGSLLYIVSPDNVLRSFDTDGTDPQTVGEDMAHVFTAHDSVWAVTGTGAATHVGHLLAIDGDEIAGVDVPLGDWFPRVGATELGLHFWFNPNGRDESPGFIAAHRPGLLSPTGRLVTRLPDPLTPTLREAVWRAHGRYLLVTDTYVDPIRMSVFLQDGTLLGSVELPRGWDPIAAAGSVVAYSTPTPSVQFRDLAGNQLGDYPLAAGHSIEHVVQADRHLWIVTTDGDDEHVAHVFDLGSCDRIPSAGRFADDDLTVFESDVEWLAREQITMGCNPRDANTWFCPDDVVTRGQMAAFLTRALHLPPSDARPFDDASDSVFAADIAALAAAGITRGCTPTAFCPDDPVTRGQMAAFLTRALHLPASLTQPFTDTTDSLFEADIAALAAAGITRGCTPTAFCPDDPVTRGQMAAFLRRALG